MTSTLHADAATTCPTRTPHPRGATPQGRLGACRVSSSTPGTPERSLPFRPQPSEDTTLGMWAGAGRLMHSMREEWILTCRSPTSRHELSRWQHKYPALRCADSLPALLDHLDRAPRPEKDAILKALVMEFQDGRQLAGRTVLQAMLPKLHRLRWHGTTDSDPDEASAATVATFWQVLSSYPTRRPGSVAGNLGLDTLRRLQARTAAGSAEVPYDPYDLAIVVRADLMRTHGSTTTAQHPLVDPQTRGLDQHLSGPPDLATSASDVIDWARTAGVISQDQALALRRTYVPEDGAATSSLAVGRELGVPPATIRQRISRACRSIRVALDAETRLLEAC